MSENKIPPSVGPASPRETRMERAAMGRPTHAAASESPSDRPRDGKALETPNDQRQEAQSTKVRSTSVDFGKTQQSMGKPARQGPGGVVHAPPRESSAKPAPQSPGRWGRPGTEIPTSPHFRRTDRQVLAHLVGARKRAGSPPSSPGGDGAGGACEAESGPPAAAAVPPFAGVHGEASPHLRDSAGGRLEDGCLGSGRRGGFAGSVVLEDRRIRPFRFGRSDASSLGERAAPGRQQLRPRRAQPYPRGPLDRRPRSVRPAQDRRTGGGEPGVRLVREGPRRPSPGPLTLSVFFFLQTGPLRPADRSRAVTASGVSVLP